MSRFVVGETVEGRVCGLQRYGVFIMLDENTQGLVHISEITNGYVKNITDFAAVGDIVLVKILSVDELDGKIALSMKDANRRIVPQKSLRYSPGRKVFPVETNNGFRVLKEKLDFWIKQEMDT